MTRDELIARIEAGETGPELLREIARLAQWKPGEAGPGHDGYVIIDPLGLWFPNWLTSIDAAEALVGDCDWRITRDSYSEVWIWQSIYTAHVTNNPAAALVAAWLKATA